MEQTNKTAGQTAQVVDETVNNESATGTMAVDLGISSERNILLVDIVRDTIKKMGDEGKEIDRTTALKECAQTLPADMTREETLYVGYIIQVKAEQYVRYAEAKKLKEMLDGPDGMKAVLEKLFS